MRCGTVPHQIIRIRSTKLTDDDYEQLSLFDTAKDKKLERLDSVLDSIRVSLVTMQSVEQV